MKTGSYQLLVQAITLLTMMSAPSLAWPLDLKQAYLAALEEDATILAAKAATAARQERLPQARAQLLPNLSANITHNRNHLERTAPNILGQPTTTNENYFSGNKTLTLRQPLFRKYQMADYRQAQAQVNDANAILEQEMQNVAVRVSGAYFEALQAGEQLALVLSQKVAYSSQLDAARKRLAAGAGTRTDIDEAEAALDLNLAHELEARQHMDFTRRQLQTLINRPIDYLASLDAEKIVLAPPNPNVVEAWIERTENNSPEIQSAKAQLEAARIEVQKARAGHYPTLDAIAQISNSKSENVTSTDTSYDNKLIGLQLNIPLYAGGQVGSTIRQALAEQERATQALEALRRDIGVRVHHEFRGVTEGILKVRAFEKAVRSTEQVSISNRRSFQAGSRTLIDTLNAEQQKVAAQRDLTQARLMFLISKIRLQALSGGPTAELIDEVNSWLKH